MTAPHRKRAQQLARQRRRAVARARRRAAAGQATTRPPASGRNPTAPRPERAAADAAAPVRPSGATATDPVPAPPEPGGPPDVAGGAEEAPDRDDPVADEHADERAEGPAEDDAGTAPDGAAPGARPPRPAPGWALGGAEADAFAARHGAGDRRGTATTQDARLAFDTLYERGVRSLTRQTYLLTGRRRLAEWAVRRAFHTAWERWPEVAVDRDPVGWVRAAAHDLALSPWHRLRPRLSSPEAYPGVPEDGALLEALLSLPPVHRRVLLLHDGVGLGLAETAAETEASTPATANRLLGARETLATHVPEIAGTEASARGPLIARLLHRLAAAQPLRVPPARDVRRGSDRLTFGRTAAACGVTALVVAATSFTVATTERGDLLPTGIPAAVRHLAE
ncbi:hypothetical protein [Streptomyces sp. GSL17-111]|uniref:hypothetical protein n=1 Tax=Streptomyces sp. GSL17-111 TaxID=3121596 RepID=UPI0030F4643B